jgi:hypothetical protein
MKGSVGLDPTTVGDVDAVGDHETALVTGRYSIDKRGLCRDAQALRCGGIALGETQCGPTRKHGVG